MFNGVQIERDPDVNCLVNNVFNKLTEIQRTETEDNEFCINGCIKFVSFEDALKELVLIYKHKN